MVGLKGYGLEIVEQVPIEIEPSEYDRCALECKKLKLAYFPFSDSISKDFL